MHPNARKDSNNPDCFLFIMTWAIPPCTMLSEVTELISLLRENVTTTLYCVNSRFLSLFTHILSQARTYRGVIQEAPHLAHLFLAVPHLILRSPSLVKSSAFATGCSNSSLLKKQYMEYLVNWNLLHNGHPLWLNLQNGYHLQICKMKMYTLSNNNFLNTQNESLYFQ